MIERRASSLGPNSVSPDSVACSKMSARLAITEIAAI